MNDDTLHLLTEEPKSTGVAVYVAISLFLHFSFLLYWYLHRPEQIVVATPPARFVELSSQTFKEAPGARLEHPPHQNVPLSNANRRASSETATGTERVADPGDGANFSQPRSSSQTRPATESHTSASDAASTPQAPTHVAAAAASPVDWRGALRQIARGPSPSSAAEEGENSTGGAGGDAGFADNGPVSFETKWYDWGDYAEGMVRRIRRNWYDHMPELIKLGMKGVVTIQFTIQRNGTLTDVTIVDSSGIPPFDNAARQGIELSSPLAPLPADFPNRSERVTAQFYYNLKPEPAATAKR